MSLRVSLLLRAGGASNASTDSEVTVYQFEVLPKYLPEALDR
jgi:secreted Zn-dependent insulinase-like peptidase